MTKLLKDIAYQCPKLGGKVVFRARALYQLVEHRVFDDENLCSGVQALQSSEANALLFEGESLDKNIKSMADNQIWVYPNPTKGLLQINLPAVLVDQELYFTLFDMRGQQIQRSSSKNIINQQLDIKNIPAGVYWLNIRSDKETILHQRIVVLP